GRALAVGDFDGDGRPDVACAPAQDAYHGVRILRGDGAGGLTPRGGFERGFGEGPRDLLATDLDGDGDDDLLSTDPYGTLGIHFNDGAGGFTGIERGVSSPDFGVGIALAQLDRDAAPEVIVASARRIRGGPGFDVHQAGEDPLLERGRYHSYYHFHERESAPNQACAGDLDGDGRPDVACAPAQDAYHGVRILRGDGAGGLTPRGGFERGFGDGPRDLLATDLDGDGDDDLLSTDPYGTLGIHFNDGTGGFTGIERGVSSPDFGVGIALAQLDRDDAPEVIVASARRIRGGPHFDVYQTGEDPLLERGRFHSYYHFHGVEPAPNQICSGDLDGDGNVDLVLLSTITCAGQGCSTPGGSRIGVVRSRPNGALGAITFHPAVPLRRLRVARFAPGPAEMVLSGGDGIHRARLDESGALETPRRIAEGLDAWPVDANGDGLGDLVVAVTADTL
ncbi:MAG TPA: FG-GAP-like repeat-containing protein, partial [Gemmatimonadaceae bacterium]|nr:FG-GAP-like repeat-containing protein [Gemmatimonadaceae bacterium]